MGQKSNDNSINIKKIIYMVNIYLTILITTWKVNG